MMECRYCGAEGARMKIGPGIFFCDQRCNVFDALKNFPGSALDEMMRTLYPEMAEEFDRLMDEHYDKTSQRLGFDASGTETGEG